MEEVSVVILDKMKDQFNKSLNQKNRLNISKRYSLNTKRNKKYKIQLKT